MACEHIVEQSFASAHASQRWEDVLFAGAREDEQPTYHHNPSPAMVLEAVRQNERYDYFPTHVCDCETQTDTFVQQTYTKNLPATVSFVQQTYAKDIHHQFPTAPTHYQPSHGGWCHRATCTSCGNPLNPIFTHNGLCGRCMSAIRF